ncbi:hypothetical protein GLOIN_2v1844967 [Rhizophagus clarus]|uniref:Uncharacterized protein n=1 Tax=Rhizophagus clarus TaxID=94130 RepID=A0A8H3M964_9GLOM|nr:hypothetical protein GLOIN_2v1844967 [Rhizophagus clarus]
MPLSVFVAGIESTSQIEGMNAITIKKTILEKYLTINIVTAIKEEMSQCLYLQVTIISFSEVDFIQDQDMDEHVRFIEDNYNVQMVKLQSIIDEIGKEDIREI